MVNDLDKYIGNYTGLKASVEERFMTKATIELARQLCKNKHVLHMGLGNGLVARFLDNIVSKQTIIEGSSLILDKFSFSSKKTDFIEVLFENFQSENKFDIILANHVMEHVANPINLLNYIKLFLGKRGKIFITVPNANSIHRLIGVEMGLLKDIFELNKSDIKAGHKRVYNLKSLSNDVIKAGLNIEDSGGYNLKMVSLSQMQGWSQELLDAIFTVSKSIPKEICTNLWIICTKKEKNE